MHKKYGGICDHCFAHVRNFHNISQDIIKNLDKGMNYNTIRTFIKQILSNQDELKNTNGEKYITELIF